MKNIWKILVLFLGFSSAAFGSQDGQSLSRLYKRLSDIDQKIAVMQSIATLDDRSLEPFLGSALNDLVYGDLSQYRVDRSTYDRWELLTRLVVMELGDIKGQSASEAVWDVARTAEVPLLKAEAMISLGRMRALQYAPEIATILRNLNFNVRADKEAAEIEAYGAVLALATMADDVGFEPLFYAAIGWYQDRVTQVADKALLESFDNPVNRLDEILVTAGDYGVKRKAFRTGIRAEAPMDQKLGIVKTALTEGLRYAESDYTRRRQLANLRMDAITTYITLAESAEGIPSLLDKSIDEGDLDEGLIAIQALGADGSDSAVAILVDRLENYNERQASGLGLDQGELTTVRQIIFALGESGNPLGLDALGAMAYLDYTPALVRQAEEAIKKIQDN